jgi:1-acyl-sn-glycerol-3-phosphate acyltransferase
MSAELRELALARGERRSSRLLYRLVRAVVRSVVHPWLRIQVRNAEVLDRPGPTILAPVHRSHLDSVLVATQSRRRIRALGKQSLFTTPGVSYLCAALGAIPVRRGEADRDALQAARPLLDRGESLIVFPEGGRRHGNEIGPLFDGAGWLAARSGAPVVPIGIAGTEAVMPMGARRPRRSRVAIVVGDPLPAPRPPEGQTRVGRQAISSFTAELATHLSRLQDEASALAGGV